MSLSGFPTKMTFNWSLTSTYFYVISYVPGILAIFPYLDYAVGFFPIITEILLLIWLIEVLYGNWTISNTVNYITVIILMALVPLFYLSTLLLEIILIPLVWLSFFNASAFGILYLIAYLIAYNGY